MEEALRHQVRFLTTRLGAIVREQSGTETFAAIENLRQLSKQIRRRVDPALLATAEREVRRLTHPPRYLPEPGRFVSQILAPLDEAEEILQLGWQR